MLLISMQWVSASETAAELLAKHLAAMPSKEGPHIVKIKALKPGEWLDLGRPTADPKWGEGRGRSWCQQMNYAPDLRGAFMTGEGVHAYIKPDKHYMDDHFLYDINAHAWVCIHPGVKAGDDQGLKMADNGLLLNADGNPIPCGLLAHNYDQTAYDSKRKQFAFIPKGGATGWWITMKCKQVKALGKEANARMKKQSWGPWLFDVKAGHFRRNKAESKGPMGTQGGGCFKYLAVHDKYFLRTQGNRSYLFDPASGKWAAAAPTPVAIKMGYDTVSCVDTQRGLLILAGGNKPEANGVFLAYDASKDAWTQLPPIPGKPRLTGNSGSISYNAAKDLIVANISAVKGMLFYDCKEGKWLSDKPEPAQGGMVFYDPELQVHFYFQARDSANKGVMKVYKCK